MSQIDAVSQISSQVAEIHAAEHEDALERVVTILDEDVAICVLRHEPSLAEQVDEQDQTFDTRLAPALRAAVERTTGRTVTAVNADIHGDPDITLLTFTLAPAAASSAG